MINEIKKLPLDWTPRSGLMYPLKVRYMSEDVLFSSYQEHHEFIKTLFKPKTHENLIK